MCRMRLGFDPYLTSDPHVEVLGYIAMPKAPDIELHVF